MAATAKEKERVMVYLDPDLSRKLRHERADTRVSVSEIVESAVRDRYARAEGRRRPAAPN